MCAAEQQSGGGGSLFNGRDRGPWGLSSPQLEALEERLGAVLLIQVGLIMPVHPLPLTLPPLHQIWEETHDKGRQAGGGGSVSLWVCTTCGHRNSPAWAQGTLEISLPYYLCYSPALASGLFVAPLSRNSQLCWSCIRINQHPNNMANAINWVRHCATIKWGFFLLNQWSVPITCDSGLKCGHWHKRKDTWNPVKPWCSLHLNGTTIWNKQIHCVLLLHVWKDSSNHPNGGKMAWPSVR